MLTSANAKPVAVLGLDCLEKNMTIFPAHMGNIDNRQRVGRLDNQVFIREHSGKLLATAQNRKRAFQPLQIEDGLGYRGHSLAQNFQNGFLAGSSCAVALNASGLTAGTGMACVAAAGAGCV